MQPQATPHSPLPVAAVPAPTFRSVAAEGKVGVVRTPISALAPGAVLAGRFRLLRRLGAGGLAEVWAAADAQAGGEVAIKLLHGHLCADAGLVERFERELLIARSLSHPRLVRVFDLHRHEGRPLFSMELLRGQSLAERLEREGRPPRDEALRLARQIAEGLAHAHDAGVVHRDLKPHNVFLCAEQAGPPTVKLLDFGLARAAGFARLTAASTVMGTPGYMAPEVLQGASADPRADLYALGATLFELLSGRRAFSPLDVAGALALKAEAPPSPREVDPAVEGRDDAIVRRLLEPDPEKRYLDARQVLRALDGGEVPLPPEVPPPLVRGDHDVVVLSKLWHRAGPALARVLGRLAAAPGNGWRLGLALTGARTLVAGASRASAEAVVRICAREGLAAQVRPARREGRAARWLRDASVRLPGAFALGCALFVLGANVYATEHGWQRDALRAAIEARPPSAYGRTLLAAMEARPWLFTWGAAFVERFRNTFVVLVLLFVPLLAATAVAGLLEPAPLGRQASAPGRRRWPWSPGRGGSRWQAFWEAALLTAGVFALDLVSWTVPIARVAAQGELSLSRLLQAWSKSLAPGTSVLFALAAAYLAVRSWTRPPRTGAALPAGDPALVRLAASVQERLAALRARFVRAPEADRMVLRSLLQVAEQAGGEAARLVERTGASSGDPADREKLAGRLLRLGAAMDDALAAVGSQEAAPAAEAGERLRLALAALDAGAPTAVPLAALAPPGATPVEGLTAGRPADPARSA